MTQTISLRRLTRNVIQDYRKQGLFDSIHQFIRSVIVFLVKPSSADNIHTELSEIGCASPYYDGRALMKHVKDESINYLPKHITRDYTIGMTEVYEFKMYNVFDSKTKIARQRSNTV